MTRKFYTPKALIDGYKLGKKYLGKTFIAVPDKVLVKNKIITFKNKIMDISNADPIGTRKFPDKFGRGSYTLYYYEWKPQDLTLGCVA